MDEGSAEVVGVDEFRGKENPTQEGKRVKDRPMGAPLREGQGWGRGWGSGRGWGHSSQEEREALGQVLQRCKMRCKKRP